MTTILLYGDTIRHPALRHEVPLAIVYSFLFVAHDDRRFVLASALETSRIARALPGAEVVSLDEQGDRRITRSG